MHRATPVNSSFRSFSAGGARALLQKVGEALPADSSKLMQEVSASFMKGESRSKIEAPNPYGFTSVPFDPDEAKDGKPGLGPETVIHFLGGSRSLPIAGPIDDRRHRLKGLKPGDVSLFRGKDDGQQITLSEAGTFISAFAGKALKMQVVPKPEQGGGKGDGKPTGQEAVFQMATQQFLEITKDGTSNVNKVISQIADSSLISAVKDGAQQLVASSFAIGAPSANLRAGETPKPTDPTTFNIIGAASATISMSAPTAPFGNSSNVLATTEFVGLALAAARRGPLTDTPQVVTGSRASGAAFASLFAALVTLGLIVDQTTP